MNGRRRKVSKIHLKFNQNEIHETTHIALSRTQHSNLSLLIMWNFGKSQLETLAMKSHVVLNIFQTQGLLKWKEATREKKFWAQHIQFRIHIHTQMFCAMSHKAWWWWWWRRRRVVGAGRSFFSSSFTFWKRKRARGGWNNFLNIFMYSTFVDRNFPCMLLSICLGESEKRRKFIWNWRRRFQFDHVEKSLCVRCRMNECELRCLEKLLNTTEIEAWKKKRTFENSHTRLLGTRTGGERDIRLKENWYAIWCHFCKRFVKRKRFFQRFFNNHLIRVENRGIFLDEFLSLPSAAIWKFLLSFILSNNNSKQKEKMSNSSVRRWFNSYTFQLVLYYFLPFEI